MTDLIPAARLPARRRSRGPHPTSGEALRRRVLGERERMHGRLACASLPAPARKWWTLGTLSVAVFMITLDDTIVNVALPSIQRDN